jgi:hypothetical protein
MKQKYKHYTNKYCYMLSQLHFYTDSVKEASRMNTTYIRMRKKWDFSKDHFHYKYNPYLAETMDIRKGWNIISNTSKFEKHFNKWCEMLKAGIIRSYKIKATASNQTPNYESIREACQKVVDEFIASRQTDNYNDLKSE